MIPPKPVPREGRVSLLRYLAMFRRDILSAQPARLYRAWMATFRAPFLRSALVNDPALVREVLEVRPADFPKSPRVTSGLALLLGRSVFVTDGAEWARARALIDPVFAGGRVKDSFPAMLAAARGAADRVQPGAWEAEAAMSHATADVIFRAMVSRPIEDADAAAVFAAFRGHQQAQPVLHPGALVPFLPRWHGRQARATAATIRDVIARMVAARAGELAAGTAPDDLVTRLMQARDAATGQGFTPGELADQVAIFFLAGHETSAAALSWALWLLATYPEVQDRVAGEAAAFAAAPGFGALASMPATRDVVREALRLYPPVPMMVRQARQAERFRGRRIAAGCQVVISPWHLHRHERLWADPDAFRPDRWGTDAGRASARDAYLPFSAGPRVCPGAGFALTEAAVILAVLLARWRFTVDPARIPVPQAQLTVRARDGIWLVASPRA
ncbi:MAG: cytochrome P450 [Rhodobacteraceae bacterium]|jgi:cytochrome P450|nr:cytochrome P450 [Paracoccaceae bacterium]